MFLLKKLQSKKNDTSNFYVFDILEICFLVMKGYCINWHKGQEPVGKYQGHSPLQQRQSSKIWP